MEKEKSTNEDTREAFTLAFKLACLSMIEADLGTFRDSDFLSGD